MPRPSSSPSTALASTSSSGASDSPASALSSSWATCQSSSARPSLIASSRTPRSPSSSSRSRPAAKASTCRRPRTSSCSSPGGIPPSRCRPSSAPIASAKPNLSPLSASLPRTPSKKRCSSSRRRKDSSSRAPSTPTRSPSPNSPWKTSPSSSRVARDLEGPTVSISRCCSTRCRSSTVAACLLSVDAALSTLLGIRTLAVFFLRIVAEPPSAGCFARRLCSQRQRYAGTCTLRLRHVLRHVLSVEATYPPVTGVGSAEPLPMF
mmetsp:Transcript_9360/g.29837  ORF Transcript_9360/g.29837 Transcript_9360/m.29837 type:complete len:264 (+) Transcript_9360:1624-2415(+)